MSTLEKIKRFLGKLKSKVSKPKVTVIAIIGYYNGDCPECKTHIGTDVLEDERTHERHAFCGNCRVDIYQKLDKAKIVMLEDV